MGWFVSLLFTRPWPDINAEASHIREPDASQVWSVDNMEGFVGILLRWPKVKGEGELVDPEGNEEDEKRRVFPLLHRKGVSGPFEDDVDKAVVKIVNTSPERMVTITFGPPDGKRKTITALHRDLLCDRSPFFKAAFEGKFKEAAEQSITFPEIDPDVLEDYIKKVYCKDSYRLVSGRTDKDVMHEEFIRLCKLSVFAEMIMDDEVLKYIQEELSNLKESGVKLEEGMEGFPLMDAVQIIFEGTPDNHPLRNTILEYVFQHGDESYASLIEEKVSAQIPPDFLKAVTVHFLRHRVHLEEIARREKAVGSSENFCMRWLEDQHVIEYLVDRVARRDDTIKKVQERVGRRKAVIGTLEDGVARRVDYIRTLEGRVGRRDAGIAALEGRVGRRDTTIQELSGELKQTQDRVDELEQQLKKRTMPAYTADTRGKKRPAEPESPRYELRKMKVVKYA